MQPFVAAVVQAGSVVFDRDVSLTKAAERTRDAAAEGAKLVVFPEAFIGGYPHGATFGAIFGDRKPEGREEFVRYFDAAVEVPGPAVDSLGEMAGDHNVHLVMGVIERDGGTLYCTVLFFGPDGAYLGKHRKLMPTALERVTWGFGDGSTLTVLDTPLGKLGAVICWENYMPLLRTAMYAKGIQLYCAPTADSRNSWRSSMQHIALEGRCFVLSACQYLTRADVPSDLSLAEPAASRDTLMRGGSCIVSPVGKLLAGPDYEGECILTAELDPADLARGKFDFDAVGHYARPDIFHLTVNERPMRPVTRIVDDEDEENEP